MKKNSGCFTDSLFLISYLAVFLCMNIDASRNKYILTSLPHLFNSFPINLLQPQY